MTRPAQPAWRETEAVSDPSADETDARWHEVFNALAHGRVAALDELYDLAANDVYRLALWRTGSAEDAEDVVQDVLVRAAELGHRLAAVRRPRTWLLTVAHRRAVDLVRRERRRRATALDETPFLVAPAADLDRGLEARSLSRLIARLPEKQRVVLLLHHFADCTFADIGRITGVPTFTAASRHRLAVARLRRLLEDSHDASK